MRPSQERDAAAAVDDLIDRLQHDERDTPTANSALDPETVQLIHDLHRLARATPRRRTFVDELHARLLDGVRHGAPGAVPARSERLRSSPRLTFASVRWPLTPTNLELRSVELAAGLLFVLLLMAALAFVLRQSAPRQLSGGKPAPLIVSFGNASTSQNFRGFSLHLLDPDTLADVSGTVPLEAGDCASGPVPDRLRRMAVVGVGGGMTPSVTCPPSSTLHLRTIDLQQWQWTRDIELQGEPDRTLEFAWTPTSTPLIWSPDGSRLYVFTVSRPWNMLDWPRSGPSGGETRQMWIVDPGGGPSVSVSLDLAPWRVNVSSAGLVYVLGYQTRGPSKWGYLEEGSTTLLVIDPITGSIRSRVPLPRVKVASAPPLTNFGWDPGVALSSNNRYYFVAHPDEPVIDVVDVAAPGLERLERSIQTGSTAESGPTTWAWVALSPDNRRLFAHRWRGLAVDGGPLAPTQMVDVGNWTITTVDRIAAAVGLSGDGQWLFAFDPPRDRLPNGLTPGENTSLAGAGLRVLDVTGHEVARLLHDQIPMQFGQFAANRLYVVTTGSDFAQSPVFRAPAIGQAVYELIAYEAGTWRVLARRPWHFPLFVEPRPRGF